MPTIMPAIALFLFFSCACAYDSRNARDLLDEMSPETANLSPQELFRLTEEITSQPLEEQMLPPRPSGPADPRWVSSYDAGSLSNRVCEPLPSQSDLRDACDAFDEEIDQTAEAIHAICGSDGCPEQVTGMNPHYHDVMVGHVKRNLRLAKSELKLVKLAGLAGHVKSQKKLARKLKLAQKKLKRAIKDLKANLKWRRSPMGQKYRAMTEMMHMPVNEGSPQTMFDLQESWASNSPNGEEPADDERIIDAAYDGETAKIKQLVESGVNVNTKGEGGWTALLWAIAAASRDPRQRAGEDPSCRFAPLALPAFQCVAASRPRAW